MNGRSRACQPGSHAIDSSDSTASLPEWSSIDDFAAWLGESRRTVEWMRYAGRAPRAHKFGARVKFHRSSIAAWVAEQAEP